MKICRLDPVKCHTLSRKIEVKHQFASAGASQQRETANCLPGLTLFANTKHWPFRLVDDLIGSLLGIHGKASNQRSNFDKYAKVVEMIPAKKIGNALILRLNPQRKTKLSSGRKCQSVRGRQ
ncbi:hypothetical protein EVAR_103150_1 [Eumeta japonica]|uniref:Uncharacterized protein n=1 Tax=Eumeta variegata TaxID=151549 RepID=A0A4C1YG09_EUMVA|nr:hypothetical protein EVAR_103150_1 [Eumeta japonica]